MGFVIKRGGRKQAFSGAKIKSSIQKSAREAGLSSSKIQELAYGIGESVINLYKN